MTEDEARPLHETPLREKMIAIIRAAHIEWTTEETADRAIAAMLDHVKDAVKAMRRQGKGRNDSDRYRMAVEDIARAAAEKDAP